MPQETGNSKLLAAVLQHVDGVGVVNLGEVGGDEALQTADGVLVHVLGEELQIVAALGQHGVEDVLQHGFGQGGVVFQESAKATSGSTIQNSARWRLVLEFSARKVGPKV